eukprot:Colp12_sorted_trinity150504_noHs@35155
MDGLLKRAEVYVENDRVQEIRRECESAEDCECRVGEKAVEYAGVAGSAEEHKDPQSNSPRRPRKCDVCNSLRGVEWSAIVGLVEAKDPSKHGHSSNNVERILHVPPDTVLPASLMQNVRSDDPHEVGADARVRLHIDISTVVGPASDRAGRVIAAQSDDDTGDQVGHEGQHPGPEGQNAVAEDDQWDDKQRGDDVELHVIGQVPSPAHALLREVTRVEVVDVEEVSPPVLVADFLVVFSLSVEVRAIAKKHGELGVEEETEHVGRREPPHAVEVVQAPLHLALRLAQRLQQQVRHKEPAEEEERIHSKECIAHNLEG